MKIDNHLPNSAMLWPMFLCFELSPYLKHVVASPVIASDYTIHERIPHALQVAALVDDLEVSGND